MKEEQAFNKIRLLRADEIECRIATVNEKGISLLLFKDARVDQRILDETFTPFGWKRSHQSIDGNLYCMVEIWDEKKQCWIGKQDVGTMSYAEKEKGQASDSFKRACFNWGIGRELYTAPFIWLPAGTIQVQKNGDKYACYERFEVSSITYDGERSIASLVLKNKNGQEVYSWKKQRTAAMKAERHLSERQMEELKKELMRTGVTMDAVLERYHLEDTEGMTAEIYQKAMGCLKKSKNRAA